MNFLQWFQRYERWDVLWWMAIVTQFTVAEFLGLTKGKTTFTDFLRTLLPQNHVLRFVIVGVACGLLFWHFYVQRSNWK